jgi:hypothetical protein
MARFRDEQKLVVPGKKGGPDMTAYTFRPVLGNIDTLPATLEAA